MADTSRRDELAWKVLSTGTGVLGALLTRQLLQAIWPAGDEAPGPPFNPADRRVPWSTAAQWAIGAGIGAGLARVVGQRAAAAGWERAKGSPPPGVRT